MHDVTKPQMGIRLIQAQDKPVDLNIKYDQMFIDLFSDSVQLTYRIRMPVTFWCSAKEEYP